MSHDKLNTGSEKTSENIQKLNLMFLMTIRDVAKVDSDEAVTRFGLDSGTVQRIKDMEIAELISMSCSTSIQFKPRAPLAYRCSMKEGSSDHRQLINLVSAISEVSR